MFSSKKFLVLALKFGILIQFWMLLHMEWCRDPILSFCMLFQHCFVEEIITSPWIICWHPFQRWIDCQCEDVFLDISFDSINLHVCSYANPHCLDYCNLEVSFEIRKCESPNFSYSKPPWISKWALGSACPAPRRSQLRFRWELGCICGWMWECFHHISVTLFNPWTYSVFLFIWNFHSLSSLIILWMKTCVSFIKWVPEYIFKIFIACMSVTNVCMCLPECVCGVQRSTLRSQFFFSVIV